MALSNFLLSIILLPLLAAVGVHAHGIASVLVLQWLQPKLPIGEPAPYSSWLNTFISPDKFSTPDMVFRLGAKSAGAAAPCGSPMIALRHEIIALHAAANSNGAQSYPFCYNPAIGSTGTASPGGIPATDFYKASDPGIRFDLFSHPTAHVISGAS
ncbi:glycosyl hydrolase family 61-domain-containing protein [Hypoxylon sp. FL1150]|nr:glycosyl hydrolase family 61-domain-containing protein [Hypoxylon sp. FL1150]